MLLPSSSTSIHALLLCYVMSTVWASRHQSATHATIRSRFACKIRTGGRLLPEPGIPLTNCGRARDTSLRGLKDVALDRLCLNMSGHNMLCPYEENRNSEELIRYSNS